MFSKSTEYALRAVIYLAQHSSEQNKIGIQELADAIDSPKSFTAKILQKLTKDQVLVQSVTGPGGGFYLTPESKNVSIYSVLKVLDEETVVTGCVLGLHECSEINPCPMHSIYKTIKPRLLSMFEEKTIQQLSESLKKEKSVLKNRKKSR